MKAHDIVSVPRQEWEELTRHAHQLKKEVLSEKEACFYLGVSRSFLAQGRIYGDLPGRTPTPPFLRIGRMIRYRREDLDAWMETYRQSPKGGQYA